MSAPEPFEDDAAEPVEGVPAVVAVVVTHDPGDWFEECLTALAAQDYPNLSVLVLDSASAEDPTTRVARVLPTAFIRRHDDNAGFGATANEVLHLVEGASHFVFLHDDVAPAPDAVRLMVEEAFRSNAGVVAPKLVAWDDDALLLAVGATADKSGVPTPFGRGELDQEQHDAVRDVFVAPGGCTLVRADLFAGLGGFDPAMTMFGEDVDLSWRAQVLGARVVVTPDARVRHVEAASAGLRGVPGDVSAGRLIRRHRLRSVFKAYSLLTLLRVVPQLVFLQAAEALLALAMRRREVAAAVVDAWRWNVGERASWLPLRRSTQKHRLLPDGVVRRLQTRGNSRLRGLLRGGLAAEERTLGVGAAGRELAGALRQGGLQLTLLVWFAIAVVLLVGSRDLFGRIAAVGELTPFPESPLDLLRRFVSGWSLAGLGSPSPAPVAFGLLGLAGSVLFGAMGLLRTLLVLGLVPLGIAGVHRLSAPIGSWRARLLAAALYAAVPLPYDAIARGRWATLISYAVAPWLLSRLLLVSRVAPFGGIAEPDELPARRRARRRRHHRDRTSDIEALLGAEAATMGALDTEELRVAVAAVEGVHADDDDDLPAMPMAVGRAPGRIAEQWAPVGLLLAVAGALAPPILPAALVLGVALLIAGVLAGDVRAGLRSLGLAAAGVATAAALLFPWTLEVAGPGAGWESVLGLGPPSWRAAPFTDLVRFDLGALPAGPFAWGLVVVATLPLLIGGRWRWAWAVRLWSIAAVCWTVAWAAGRGWLLVPSPSAEVLLGPAACALAVAAALGVAAFETDLPAYRFGWRQVASVVAAISAIGFVLPVIAGSLDGRWKAPATDFAGLLSWMQDRKAEGAFRVLWVGDPEALPVDGWRLDDDLAYATSRDGAPDVSTRWPGSDDNATGLLADALGVARRGETSRLGHLIAPMAVRYIAVPVRAAPTREGTPRFPVPAELTEALRAQIDLRLVETDDALVVYENAAWGPGRAMLTADAAVASRQRESARTVELRTGQAVLPEEQSPTRYSGPIPKGTLFLSESRSDRWELEAGSGSAESSRAFGWANAFDAPADESATLAYATSPVRWIALLLELAIWVVVARATIATARRRRAAS